MTLSQLLFLVLKIRVLVPLAVGGQFYCTTYGRPVVLFPGHDVPLVIPDARLLQFNTMSGAFEIPHT